MKAAVYILNRAPTKSLNGKTPFEAWFGKKPRVRHFRTFGCTAYAKRIGPGISKLSDRSTPGVFFGYESGTKGYRIYNPINDKLIVSRDVIFDEKKAWNWGEKESRQGNEALAPYTFSIQYPDTVPGPTTGLDSELGADPSLGGAPASPAGSIPSQGDSSSPPHTPISSGTAAMPFQWATPPTDASEDSDGAPRRYRTIPNLLDTTEEVHGFEYSGLCLVAAEEPGSVEEARKEDC